jgi:hypothetical protein
MKKLIIGIVVIPFWIACSSDSVPEFQNASFELKQVSIPSTHSNPYYANIYLSENKEKASLIAYNIHTHSIDILDLGGSENKTIQLCGGRGPKEMIPKGAIFIAGKYASYFNNHKIHLIEWSQPNQQQGCLYAKWDSSIKDLELEFSQKLGSAVKIQPVIQTGSVNEIHAVPLLDEGTLVFSNFNVTKADDPYLIFYNPISGEISDIKADNYLAFITNTYRFIDLGYPYFTFAQDKMYISYPFSTEILIVQIQKRKWHSVVDAKGIGLEESLQDAPDNSLFGSKEGLKTYFDFKYKSPQFWDLVYDKHRNYFYRVERLVKPSMDLKEISPRVGKLYVHIYNAEFELLHTLQLPENALAKPLPYSKGLIFQKTGQKAENVFEYYNLSLG